MVEFDINKYIKKDSRGEKAKRTKYRLHFEEHKKLYAGMENGKLYFVCPKCRNKYLVRNHSTVDTFYSWFCHFNSCGVKHPGKKKRNKCADCRFKPKDQRIETAYNFLNDLDNVSEDLRHIILKNGADILQELFEILGYND